MNEHTDKREGGFGYKLRLHDPAPPGINFSELTLMD
jgi:hypothetical protein